MNHHNHCYYRANYLFLIVCLTVLTNYVDMISEKSSSSVDNIQKKIKIFLSWYEGILSIELDRNLEISFRLQLCSTINRNGL